MYTNCISFCSQTSHATQWALYLLAQNPECQEKLLDEVNRVVGPNGQVEGKHLKHFEYVKGVIKESLRLYPVAPFLTRRLCYDIELDDYLIPAGVRLLNPLKYISPPAISSLWSLINVSFNCHSILGAYSNITLHFGQRREEL